MSHVFDGQNGFQQKNSDFLNARTHLLLKHVGPFSLSGQSQQEVEADHVAPHCGFFTPCVTDDVTGLSVMGGYWDHDNQEWSFLPTSVWLVHYETIWVWVCHKPLCCDLCWRKRQTNMLLSYSKEILIYNSKKRNMGENLRDRKAVGKRKRTTDEIIGVYH